ncbi:Transcriptional regulatory protein ZraR [Novipirellula aureliae]|uniref:Transcriptional regulatory protein ZraR n=1 Tax=Novipirellula aureliae TaxID=2527966 RepID=A0A5C6EA98_9BACT|nr:sigma 54-interacting transcriptional regulator [Novipirellula aureliae]TWU45932.1 Transcriptional regulatory protein ZraR [Novipirellula aureliae]
MILPHIPYSPKLTDSVSSDSVSNEQQNHASANQQGAYLVLQSAGRWSDVFRLSPPCEAVIGRASSNQIVVRSEQASRRHARIFWANSGWMIEDLGSRNGTFVAGSVVRDPRRLRSGDKIQIAGFAIFFTDRLGGGLGSSTGSDLGSHRGQDQATDQITMEIDADSITDRRRYSDYLRGCSQQRAVTGSLLKLAFALAQLNRLEDAVATVLDALESQLQLDTAGVYLGESVSLLEDAAPIASMGEIPLVGTRQSGVRSYRRPPETLIQNVANERGKALLARNVLGDKQLAAENSRGEIEVESIILAPICDHQDRVLGMIHLTTAGGIRPFDSEDLQWVVAAAEILAESLSRLADHDRLAKSLRRNRHRADVLQRQLSDKVRIVGKSDAIAEVTRKIALAAPTGATVLIRGESGVGKELVAAALHHTSDRSEGPLVCLNCAALSDSLLESELFGHEKGAFTGATERKRGKFEMADGGTLMLDEIGEMNSELQAKLLRVLEGHPFERVGGHEPIRVDVRVVAATNRDLQAMVGEGTFRQDLYYRLHVVEIFVPPLRARQHDCLLLATFFLDQFNRQMGRRVEGFTRSAQQKLLGYHWPGNIRELRNVVERAVVLNQKTVIDENDLVLSPAELGRPDTKGKPNQGDPLDLEISLAKLEQQHIERVLRYTDGNKSRASAILGIERSTLDRKRKKYAAEAND